MVLVTRNTVDFHRFVELRILNPWNQPWPSDCRVSPR